MKYDVAIVFKKLTNLMPYYHGVVDRMACGVDRVASFCAKERTVNLVLLIRYEYDHMNAKNRIFCKVHCPISPLPVKGEFEAPSVNAVEHFLNKMGWDKTDVLTRDILE